MDLNRRTKTKRHFIYDEIPKMPFNSSEGMRSLRFPQQSVINDDWAPLALNRVDLS